VRERVGLVFGAANFARAGRVAFDPAAYPSEVFDRIAREILADLGDIEAASFRVSARRADKRFPMASPAIEREVGGRSRTRIRRLAPAERTAEIARMLSGKTVTQTSVRHAEQLLKTKA